MTTDCCDSTRFRSWASCRLSISGLIVACDALDEWCAGLIDKGYRSEMECIIAKIFGSEAQKEAASELMMKTARESRNMAAQASQSRKWSASLSSIAKRLLRDQAMKKVCESCGGEAHICIGKRMSPDRKNHFLCFKCHRSAA